MKQYKVLQWAFSFLNKYQREEKVAELLWQHVTQQSSTMFYANMQQDIDEATQRRFEELIYEHALHGTPLQHMIGSAPFYGREFVVNKDVLIPRFETEEVVFHVIEQIKQQLHDEKITIADLGTGSGVIAITLALELPHIDVYATDISEHALQVAQKNANEHHVKVQFSHGDFLMPMIKDEINPHVIVSNPPYIAKSERNLLADTVKDYDPELALFADNQGLAAYETIVKQVTKLASREKRLLIFEIGYEQGEAVLRIIKHTFPQSDIRILQDINGKDRIVSAIL